MREETTIVNFIRENKMIANLCLKLLSQYCDKMENLILKFKYDKTFTNESALENLYELTPIKEAYILGIKAFLYEMGLDKFNVSYILKNLEADLMDWAIGVPAEFSSQFIINKAKEGENIFKLVLEKINPFLELPTKQLDRYVEAECPYCGTLQIPVPKAEREFVEFEPCPHTIYSFGKVYFSI